MKMAVKNVMNTTELGTIQRFSEDDIPGASLSGKSPDVLKVDQLKWWMACRGACRPGKKVGGFQTGWGF